MSLETEYRGYTIRYSENADEFQVLDVQGPKGRAPTLSKMKEKIDALYRQEREAAALDCYELQKGSSSPETVLLEARLTEYEGPLVQRPWAHHQKAYISEQKVASISRRGGSSKAARRTAKLENMAPIGPETDAAVDEYLRLRGIENEAKAAADAAFAAIPRVTLEDISELVRISGIDPTGGLKTED